MSVVIIVVGEKMHPYNSGEGFPAVLGIYKGEVVAVGWGECPRCGETRFFVSPCFEDPTTEQYTHREVGYCIKCGEGRDIPPLHMREEEREALPELISR